MRFERKRGIYEKYVKRMLDIICAVLALVVFGWLYIIVAILVRVKLGSPILFTQLRPGLIDPKTNKERVFKMYKFRTMTEARDESGNYLPDEMRLTRFGRILRATSLDELPEAINILRGEMSVIGPRPQLVRDMVFMSEAQRMRHTAKPGLSGLAQIKGGSAIDWDEKFKWDLKYIEKVSFLEDVRLVWMTVKQVFFRKKRHISSAENELPVDYGDVLLMMGKISKPEYNALQKAAQDLIVEFEEKQ